jgi:hypothetical protein
MQVMAMNGEVAPRVVRGKGKGKAVRRPRGRRRAVRYARGLAVAVGGVGVGVLGLSVVHCTESIGLLTGSHWALSALLAVGIDAGMVACELAEVSSHGSRAGASVRPWAMGYVLAAVVLSMLLNAYAFGQHAAGGMVCAAWLLGATIPWLVYALGRVAGYLWLSVEG